MSKNLQVLPCKLLWFELPPCVWFPEKDLIFMLLRLHMEKTKNNVYNFSINLNAMFANCITLETKTLTDDLVRRSKIYLLGLERWLCSWEHWLFFQTTQIEFPAPIEQLTAVCNLNSKRSGILAQTYMQYTLNKQTNKQTNLFKKSTVLERQQGLLGGFTLLLFWGCLR